MVWTLHSRLSHFQLLFRTKTTSTCWWSFARAVSSNTTSTITRTFWSQSSRFTWPKWCLTVTTDHSTSFLPSDMGSEPIAHQIQNHSPWYQTWQLLDWWKGNDYNYRFWRGGETGRSRFVNIAWVFLFLGLYVNNENRIAGTMYYMAPEVLGMQMLCDASHY